MNTTLTLDKFDLHILHLLQQDSRMKLATLADRVCLSISQCSRRISRMEQEGVIQGYSLQLSASALDLQITAFIFVSFEKKLMCSPVDAMAFMLNRDEVIDCHTITGNHDFIVKVKVESMSALSHFLSRVVGGVEGIREIASHVVMDTLKENGPLQIRGYSRP